MIPKFRFWYEREDYYPDENYMRDVWKIEYIADSKIELNDDYIFNPYTNAAENIYAKTKIYLMQSTGLKDKSGVEIYEGDILKTFSNINKYTDSFAEDIEPKFEYTTVVRDGACFKTTYKKRPSYVLNENSGSMVEHMEVIGNIYENPELLEREGE